MTFPEHLLRSNLNVVSWDNSTRMLTDSDQLCRPYFYLKSNTLGSSSYADDFGYQWTTLYDDYRKDRPKHIKQFSRLGVALPQLEGKVVMDVGCGIGRLAELSLNLVDCIYGVDLSSAVIEAGNLIRDPRFIPIQASADHLPIKDASIDFVYCWGVLHHTACPESTFKELWRTVKPGGYLGIWVYSDNNFFRNRSLLANYFLSLDEHDMDYFTEHTSDLAHTLQSISPHYAKIFSRDMCFTLKNTKENTKHILYDGVGPTYHYLLDKEWFNSQLKTLDDVHSLQLNDEPYTVALIRKAV